MTNHSYPHSIDNGHGELLTFLRRVPGTNGCQRLEVENFVQPMSGPPMHVHHYQEEALTVVRGRIGYQRLDGEEHFAGPGETVTFKAGDAHRFWNAGEDELHCKGYIEPADNIEYFLGEIFESAKANVRPMPHPLDAAYLATRYRSEFTMLAVPAPVQKFVFPVVVGLGRLLGRYGKYAGAPEPVRR